MEKKLKIAVLSSYTIQNIENFFFDYLSLEGFNPEIKFGGYNQFNEELVDKKSWLYEFNPQIIIVALSSKTFLPDIDFEILTQGYSIAFQKAQEKINLLLESISSSNLSAKIILTTLDKISNSYLGFEDIKSDKGVYSLIDNLNQSLISYSIKNDIELFDFDNFCSKYGKLFITDNKMYYLGKLLHNKESAQNFSRELTTLINAIYGKTKKCLIVDLDNTLWGGVIGEDGIENLVLGDSNVGNIYQEIQKIILSFQKMGFLVAIVSKNNEEDVFPIFESKEMILKKEDFIAIKINWRNKSDNIKEIAQELNLGLDSFVFLDDNPAERLEVSSNLPEVSVVDFPQDIANLPSLLRDLSYFKKISSTTEDINRHEMYIQENKRKESIKQFSKKDYLKELNIEIEVKKDSLESLERIYQLINKTNQFNLRTQRYTKEEVKKMIKSNDFIVTSVSVWDKFGDLGLTGIIILEKKNKIYFMDTFLMSCRVLSRDIEKQFFYETIKYLPKNSIIETEFIKTPKNILIENFCEDLGFEVTNSSKKGKTYNLELKEYLVKHINWIRLR